MALVNTQEIEGLPPDVPVGDGRAYAIERFDRIQGGSTRVHFEDCAQVLDRPLGHLYETDRERARHETLGAVISALCPEDLRPFVERVVFCALAGNGDAHLKNWALRYPDGRRARPSPAYDLVSTVVYPARLVDDHLALSLNGSLRFDDVNTMSFEPMARACAASASEIGTWVREATDRTRGAWTQNGSDFGYSEAERERIAVHLQRVPLR